MGDVAYGEAGDDWIYADRDEFDRPGSTTVDGGAGRDSFVFWNVGYAVTAYGGDDADRFELLGSGRMVLHGGAGGDTFVFQNFHFTDAVDVTLTLGEGRDRLVTDPQVYGVGRIVVTDFEAGDAGDRIDLLGFMQRATPWWGNPYVNPFTNGYARLTGTGGDTAVEVQFTGAWHTLFLLKGVQPGQLTANNFDGQSPNDTVLRGLDLHGTAGADSILGTNGADTLSGGAGDDVLDGAGGNDVLNGGDGADTLTALQTYGFNTVHGGAGDDRLDSVVMGGAFYGDAGADDFKVALSAAVAEGSMILDMGDGDDRASYSGAGQAVILGGAGADELTVTGSEFLQLTEFTVDAGSGDDRVVVGGAGGFRITLGAGADMIGLLEPRYSDPASRGMLAVVRDFNPGEDRLGTPPPNARIGEFRGEAVVQTPNSNDPGAGQIALRLEGVSAHGLTARNFADGVMPTMWLLGDTANDVLTAGGNFRGADGGGGDDRLLGSALADTLQGGLGSDSLAGADGADSLDGGAGDDTVSGGAGDDVIRGGEGGNVLAGDEGDDRVTGGYQADRLDGGAGADTLDGSQGDDVILGGDGRDNLIGEFGQDTLMGGMDNDTLSGGPGVGFLRGEEGDDVINGGDAFDDAHGNMGNDTVHGYGGDDWVVGGKDDDLLYGDYGSDIVYGNLGSDTCHGGELNDWVRGGQGDDLVRGDSGDDWLSGDRGADTITGGSGADIFHTFGEAGLDRVTDFNAAQGDRVNLLPGTTYWVGQSGGDVVIDMAGGGQMVLVGVQLSSLTPGWLFTG